MSQLVMSCKRCGDQLRRKLVYSSKGIESITWYCYSCENDELHRLARMAGKI